VIIGRNEKDKAWKSAEVRKTLEAKFVKVDKEKVQ
jgi:hypothetical protein